tara:strand:+ start:77 stop:337 length:261 start_codon:yes stop_codon:yes gene_type:complete
MCVNKDETHTWRYTMELVYAAPNKALALSKALLKALSKFFSARFASLVKAQQLRADYWIVHNMSDKDLKDLGITRGEIKERVYDIK